MNYVVTEKKEVKVTKSAVAQIEFDEMRVGVKRYLLLNKESMERGCTVNQLAGVKVTTDPLRLIPSSYAVLFLKGKVVATVELSEDTPLFEK